ncbi:MAG: zinc ribbon domain-containing protein [Ruminiclostridium sp.]|nr:zinc ribbon domain-containing protein [Ruminiclostridium sp.]
MFCTKCGSPLTENGKFCSQCGAAVGENPVNSETSAVPKTSEPTAAQSVQKPDTGTGRKLAITAFVLSGLAMLLSLIFAPYVYKIFSEMEISMSDEDWVLAIVTIFMYLLIKLFGAMLDALASASGYILPSLVLAMTGLALGILSRVKYKVKSFGVAPILLPVGALLLQLVVLVVCFNANPTVPIT